MAVSVAAPSELGRDPQRRYVLTSRPLVDPADREGSWYVSRDRRPRNRHTEAHSARYDRRDYNTDDDSDSGHRRRRDRRPDDRNGGSSLQSMTSWLERLGLAEEGDDYHSRMKDDTYLYRQRHHDHAMRVDRDGRHRARSPASSLSRSPSRSPSPRRRAVTKHQSFGERGRELDHRSDSPYERRERRDRRETHETHKRHGRGRDSNATQQQRPRRARSVSGRDDSHPRQRPLKRGPSSSSSSSTNSSMSKWESAARNALRAGTMAALSSHSAPGSWLGNKGTRVATAALGAALVDTYVGHRHPESVNGVRHTAIRQAAEYAISSIVAEPIMQRAARHKSRR